MTNSSHNADRRGRLPNFLIIGVAKAGTSSLYAYLGQHPQIFVSPVRAPNFFGLGNSPARVLVGQCHSEKLPRPPCPSIRPSLLMDRRRAP